MSSTRLAAPPDPLYERLASLDERLLGPRERAGALDRFRTLPSGHEKPGRFWRIDLDSTAPDAHAVETGAAAMRIENPDAHIVACDLVTAAREYPELLARVFGQTDLHAAKFGALTTAFAHLGAFVYVRADHAANEPVIIEYRADTGTAVFPYTVVLAERGGRATIVERIVAGAGAFLAGATEIVTAEHADVHYAVVQQADAGARIITHRLAQPGRDAKVAWSVAELGGELAVSDIGVAIEHPGARAEITALFFPRATQHVDVISTVDHRAGQSLSETVVKTAATESGQARFLGNIRIAPHAQGSDARLRDDALLLSKKAHVDSVPALEIGANDVKAYHGATVGALDEEHVFYMESRGITRDEAERMIALGFFEPAIERFPTAALRNEIRAALEAKLT